MLKFVFLTEQFYQDYASFPEIEKKRDRPHAQVALQVGGCLFCVPFRSHITHEYALFTDKQNRCGLDFSKSVVVTDPARYIDTVRRPYLRDNEFRTLMNISEYEIIRRLQYYIAQYKKAKTAPEKKRNAILLSCSTLQYFEEWL